MRGKLDGLTLGEAFDRWVYSKFDGVDNEPGPLRDAVDAMEDQIYKDLTAWHKLPAGRSEYTIADLCAAVPQSEQEAMWELMFSGNRMTIEKNFSIELTC